MTMKDKSGRDLTNVKKWMDMKPYACGAFFNDDTIRLEIGPEEAQMYLDSMLRNRPVQRVNVARYASDMLRGEWNEYSSRLSFDSEGHMLDGQHRMLAVQEAGITVPFRAQFNVPPETPFDIGAKRSLSDDLYMRGELPPEYCQRACGAVANRALETTLGPTRYKTLTNNDKKRFLDKYGDACLLSIEISHTGNTRGLCNQASVQAGIFAALQCKISRDALEEFCNIANSGYAHDESHYAAVTLNKYLEAKKHDTGGIGVREKQSATEQAIRDYIRRIPRKKTYFKIGFPYSEVIKNDVKEVLA